MNKGKHTPGPEGEYRIEVVGYEIKIFKGVYQVGRVLYWSGTDNDVEGLAEDMVLKLNAAPKMMEALERLIKLSDSMKLRRGSKAGGALYDALYLANSIIREVRQ